jgi:putative 4-mercaptohistidine N1-methyltranferase
VSFYESDAALGQYLLFHYGSDHEALPYPFGPREALGFPVRCVQEGLREVELERTERALDLGCAVGRSSFELRAVYDSVLGLDFSDAFVQAASRLARDGRLPYRYPVEGDLMQDAVAEVPPHLPRNHVRFVQGDACRLDASLGAFDAVLLANLLCRLPRPDACLDRLADLVHPGGVAVITTPCTWTEDYTPRAHWLGGFRGGGQDIRTLDQVSARLEPAFERIKVSDCPFLIREHERKFQWSVAQLSVWRRRTGRCRGTD